MVTKEEKIIIWWGDVHQMFFNFMFFFDYTWSSWDCLEQYS